MTDADYIAARHRQDPRGHRRGPVAVLGPWWCATARSSRRRTIPSGATATRRPTRGQRYPPGRGGFARHLPDRLHDVHDLRAVSHVPGGHPLGQDRARALRRIDCRRHRGGLWRVVRAGQGIGRDSAAARCTSKPARWRTSAATCSPCGKDGTRQDVLKQVRNGEGVSHQRSPRPVEVRRAPGVGVPRVASAASTRAATWSTVTASARPRCS